MSAFIVFLLLRLSLVALRFARLSLVANLAFIIPDNYFFVINFSISLIVLILTKSLSLSFYLVHVGFVEHLGHLGVFLSFSKLLPQTLEVVLVFVLLFLDLIFLAVNLLLNSAALELYIVHSTVYTL